MSLYGVPADYAIGMQLEEEETVKSWRPGSQLVYRLLVHSRHPNDPRGIEEFNTMMQNLAQHIQDEYSITDKDVVKMFDVLVKEDQPNVLKKILNHPLIPCAAYTGAIAKNALKQAIRTGASKVLEFLIDENVQVIATDTADKTKYDEVRSLIFNILQSVRIGYHKLNSQHAIVAHKFWTYLADGWYAAYHSSHKQKDAQSHDEALIKYTKNDNNDGLSLDDALMRNRQLKFMIRSPLIMHSIYKYIQSSLNGKKYVSKLKPIIMFVCEHFMTFDDEHDLQELHRLCEEDVVCDCSALKPFAIKRSHALQQQYGATKNIANVQLFWSEYIMVKLFNDFLGIDPSKLNTPKRMQQYGGLRTDMYESSEREEMLFCVRYIAANGAAKHLNDTLLPLLIDYKKQFIKNKDDEQEIQRLFDAVEYGNNIWTLKEMRQDEKYQLFDQSALPFQLIALIVSFVVL
mmetsp:Transcript_46302/g.76967  ORF Transcript_46302/g.76967 Transcript_46302/m.76967 type:complete len:459 (-) Transcript_46302:22-1398(-)